MGKPFNILFFGVKNVGVQGLKILLGANAPIVGVVTIEGQENEPIVKIAQDQGILVFQHSDINSSSFFDSVRNLGAERGVIFSYPRILRKGLLDLFKHGCINFHPARLPRYRGCFPTVWPILEGDSEAYCHMHYVDEGIDTGDIIDTRKIPIDNLDTGYSLYEKMVDSIGELLRKHLPDIFLKDYVGEVQDEDAAQYFLKSLPNDGEIDWQWDADQIMRFVRALWHPIFQGACAVVEGKKVELGDIDIAKNMPNNSQAFGEVVRKEGKMFISCQNGHIEVKRIVEQKSD